jgi:two-component system chemotaxis response regulator CheB
MVKILIVDDSKFMRFNLEKILTKVPGFNVIGTARNGLDALDFLDAHEPDVIILDFFMPKLDGLGTLEKIMSRKNPIPTIMITIATRAEHSDIYFKALELGAIDIIPKPSGRDVLYLDEIEKVIIQKVKIATESRSKLKVFSNQNKIKAIQAQYKTQNKKTPEKVFEKIKIKSNTLQKTYKDYVSPNKIIFIGASTGGPPKIIEILKDIQYHYGVSIIVVQHMPAGFTKGFSERLDRISSYKFTEVENEMILEAGKGYCAKGDFHLKFEKMDDRLVFVLNQEDKIWGIRPSIDYTLQSLAPLAKTKLCAIILTGMGRDGTDGVGYVKKYKGTTIAQDIEDALIDSMPKNAIETGYIDLILKTDEMASYVNEIII